MAGDGMGVESVSSEAISKASDGLSKLFGGAEPADSEASGPEDISSSPPPPPTPDRGEASPRRRVDSGIEEDEVEDLDDDSPGEQQADEDGSEAEEADLPVEGQEPESKPAEQVKIPDQLIQAAKRQGRTDDEINKLVAADPELAEMTFRRDLQMANDLAARYAAMGRIGQAPPPPQQDQPQQPPASQPGQGQSQERPEFSFKFPESAYDAVDDEVAESVLKPLESFIGEQFQKQISSLASQVDQATRVIRQQEREATLQRLDGFFDSREGFEDHYGAKKAHTQLTKEQADARDRVLATADHIRVGASIHGQDISETQALAMAHDLVTAPMQQQAARKQIASKVKGRAAQSTIRPTRRNSGEKAGDPIQEAIRKAEGKLESIFKR